MTGPTNNQADETVIARDDLQLPTPFAAPATRTEELISEVFSAVLRVSPIGADDHFSDLGGDSFMGLQLMLMLEASHGIRFEPGLLAEYETPRGIAAHLEMRG